MYHARHSKRSLILSLLSLVALVGAVSLSISLLRYPGQAQAAGASRQLRLASIPANIDVSQRLTNESEETVAVNPTNPNNIVIVTNVDHPAAGLFEGVSFDGGATWTTSLIGDGDNLGIACCDPTLSFDEHGNLFLSYLYRMIFNAGGPMVATGAPVTGLGEVGAFFPVEVIHGTNNCTYGDVAIGPAGQI